MNAIAPEAINPLTLPSLLLSERQRLPSCPAIYFCLSELDEVLYIGRASNLAQRWVAHHRCSQLAAIGKVRLAWMEMSDVELLHEIEAALIKYFNPILNGTVYSSKPQESKFDDELRRRIQNILEERLTELGWSAYRVAKEIGRMKGEDDQASRPTRYATAVRQALENPDNSSLRTIELLIAAMGGQLVIRWEQREEVVTGEREVRVV